MDNRTIGNYTINLNRPLGKGGYATVYEAKNKTGEIVAVKMLDKKSEKVKTENILKEIYILESAQHAHVIPVYDFNEDANNYYIFMKLVNKNLLQYIKSSPLTKNAIYLIACQLIDTVIYLHSIGISHLDIKLSNILISPELNIYLTDFGLAEKMDDINHPLIYKYRGTIKYSSPELHRLRLGNMMKKDIVPVDAYKSDIWSIGICLYFLLLNIYPFKKTNKEEIAESILNYDVTKDVNIPDDLIMLLSFFLQRDPSQRKPLDAILKYIKSKIYNIPNLQRYLLIKKNKGISQKKLDRCVLDIVKSKSVKKFDVVEMLIPSKYFLETLPKISYDIYLMKRNTSEGISNDTLLNLEKNRIRFRKFKGVDIGLFSYFDGLDNDRYTELSLYERLNLVGAIVIPVVPEKFIGVFQENFLDALRKFPEYNRHPSNPDLDLEGNPITYSIGDVLGNPGSIHNPFSRNLRKICSKVVTRYIKELDYPLKDNIRLQSLIFPIEYRRGNVKEGEFSRNNILGRSTEDTIFGGWLNLDSESQYFSFIPGSHILSSINKDSLKKEFVDRVGAENLTPLDLREMLDFSNFKYKMEIPPGYMILYPDGIISEKIPKISPYNSIKQLLGWRLTHSDSSIYKEKLFSEQGVTSNMNVYPFSLRSGDFMNRKIEVRPGVRYTLAEWSKNTFSRECLGESGIVDSPMKSLEYYGFTKYKEYDSDEMKIYSGIKIF